MLTLLTAALLTFPDPAGDARGDGGYILPTRPILTESALDLRSFTAQAAGPHMRFTISFGSLENPWKSPLGFSAGVTDVFVKTGLGGQQKLADTGLRARETGGWQYHLRVTGYGSTLISSDGVNEQRLPAPTVQVSGTSLIVDAAVPAGNYAYWVTSSVYTPLSGGGILHPTTDSGPLDLQATRADAPSPVDVLAPAGDPGVYDKATLAAVGETRDWVQITLWGAGALGLLITVLSTLRVWRVLGRQGR